MKTFTATELNKSPLKIFRAADQDGSVKINHDRYPDKVFILEARDRHESKISTFHEHYDPEVDKKLVEPHSVKIYQSPS